MQYDHMTKQIWNNNLVGFALLSPSGHYADINDTFCKMLHREKGEIIGQHYTKYLTKSDVDVTKYLIDGVAAGVLPSYEMQKQHLLPDGTTANLLVGTKALFDEDQMFRYYFMIAIRTENIRSNHAPGIGVPIIPMVTTENEADKLDKRISFIQKLAMTLVAIATLTIMLGGVVWWLVHAFDFITQRGGH